MQKMSVSTDDSKMKLIETKYEILYSICKQINNKEFQKLIQLNELKFKNESIYELIAKYDKNSIKCDFNVEDIEKQMEEMVEQKCIEIFELMSGIDVDREAMTRTEIQQKLKSKLNQLNQHLIETEKLNKKFDQNFQNYETLFIGFMEKVHKYYEKYKIGFKLVYDKLDSDLSMSKAQTLCIKNRLIETDCILQKYGNKETIETLREERKALESEEFQLKIDLKRAENRLSEYESLDRDLLKEYKRLKSDLECRHWAIHELNQSSGSTSTGSLISD